jgi:integrase
MKNFTFSEYRNPRTGSVSWRVYGRENGKTVRRNYATRDEAENEAFRRNEALMQASGLQALSARQYRFTTLTDDEILGLEAAKAQWAGRATLAELLQAGERSVAVSPVARPVAQLLEQWLAMIEGKLGEDWVADLRARCRRFTKDHPTLQTRDLTRARVRAWLDGLELSQVSKSHFRSALSRFFGWLVQTGVIAENPCTGITLDKPTIGTAGNDKPPAILTPEQAAALLQACMVPERVRVAGWVILCLFCGLRPEAEAARLRWSEVNLESGEIQLFGRKRGASVRIIQLTPQARAWLTLLKACKWEPVLAQVYVKKWPAAKRAERVKHLRAYVCQYSRSVLGAALRAANEAIEKEGGKVIKWKADILRHSFASYRAPVCKIDDLAREMGTSAEMLHRHYRHPLSGSDVAAFAKVLPGV